jgi:hypothetical protein
MTKARPRPIAGLVGKGGHVRTVPIRTWVKSHVDVNSRGGHHARPGVPRDQPGRSTIETYLKALNGR